MIVPEPLIELGFGVRSLSYEDFETACEITGFPVVLVDEKLIEEGLTFPRTRGGRRFRVIVLRRTLFKQQLTEAAWHEFAHAYYEHYGVRCFVRGSEDRFETQADDLALCCMIPTLWVRTKSFEELLGEGFSPECLRRRKEIYDSCGI